MLEINKYMSRGGVGTVGHKSDVHDRGELGKSQRKDQNFELEQW